MPNGVGDNPVIKQRGARSAAVLHTGSGAKLSAHLPHEPVPELRARITAALRAETP